MIYENMLPKTLSISRMNNLTDRNIISAHVKSNILNNQDGDIVLFKKGPNCIFNKIKTTTFNPYTYNLDGVNNNPYKTIPENFLIYQSCYPILYDGVEGSKCKTDGTGLNMRIYRLNKGELNKNKDNKIRFYSNVYREIITYEQIRDNILNKKICPNFVLLYGYQICKESGLNFDNFNVKKYINKNSKLQKYLLTNHDIIEEIKRYSKEINISTNKIVNDIIKIFNKNPELKQQYEMILQNLQDIDPEKSKKLIKIIEIIVKGLPYYKEILKNKNIPLVENDNYYDDDLLMALTESPTYSLLKWIEKVYVNNLQSKVMISDGMHSIKEWRSILIQLLSAYHCLLKEKIIIPNFSIRDNIFIKELKTEQSITKYWIYNINGVKHYVPNMGYLVLIDSSFRTENINQEFNDKQVLVDANDKPILISEPILKKTFKPIVISERINQLLLPVPGDDIDNNINEFKKILINTLDPNNYNENNDINKLNGVATQSQDVVELLTEIHNYCNDNITNNNVFINCINDKITTFLNNRIGTELDDTEFKAISYQTQDHKQIFNGKQINSENTKPGDLVIYHKDINISSYNIGQVISVKENNEIKIIVDLNDVSKEVNVNDFFHLPINIKQMGTPEGDSREPADDIEDYTINPI